MSLDEILFVSWDETSKHSSDRGRELRAGKNFWKRTMGVIKPSGINSHVFKGKDVETIYDIIEELYETSGVTVKKQDDANPVAEIYTGGILIGRITSNCRSEYRPFNRLYRPGF
jgi:hypothetical protein